MQPVRRLRALFLLALAPLTTALPAAAQELEADPELHIGRLDNGLRYVLLEHENPPGRANMFLHVSSGSLNETDETRGIAHFLEHMVFNGGENLPPGEVIPFFESLGMSFGQHLNAFTSFDQTTYMLSLPDTEEETFEHGFRFFEDVLFGTLLLEEEIDKERGVILQEKRSGKGPEQRIRDQVFERLAPGSTFGRRLPIGTEETIQSVDREDFLGYYGRYYVPSNATLMIVADADVEEIEEVVRETFGRGEAVETPADLDPGIEPYEEMRAIVATDDEITDGDVAFIGIDEPRPPVTTEERFREELVAEMAAEALNRRFEERINEDAVAFTSGSAFVGDLFDAMRLSQISGSGAPEDWQPILRDLATELRRARLHGFTDREVELVRKELVASAERMAERESTMPARARLMRINSAIAQGSTPIGAERRLELVQEYAPTITREEVDEAFRSLFSDTKLTVVAELPSSADVPEEAELLDMAREALSVTPDPPMEEERATELLASPPEPAAVEATTRHEGSGVMSAWLAGGARLHHRRMEIEKDQARVTITLAGGAIEETASNRGVSEAAAVAWSRPATASLSSNEIKDLMTGRKVSVRGGARDDTMFLTVSGNPEELEAGMQLAHLLLTEPKLEAPAFEQWQQEQIRGIERRDMLPQGHLQHAVADASFPPGEPRPRPLTVAQVEALTREQAQAWLDRIVARAPVEVAVVGDVGRERALELVARYVGTIGTRERIDADTLDDLREVARPEGSREIEREVESQTPVAIALAGSFGADLNDVRDRRALKLAAQTLTTRLIERVREAEAQVYSIRAHSAPATTWPGHGLFFAAAPTTPGNAAHLSAVIHEMFATFAAEGPSEEDLATARDQVLNELDESMEQPGYWSTLLGDLDYRGRTLDEVLAAREAYGSFTPDEVRSTFARYYAEDARVTVVVEPKEAATAEETSSPQEASAPQDG